MDYIFSAKDIKNNKYRGYLKATSKKEVYDYLLSRNLFPYYIARDYKLIKERKIKLKILNELIRQWLSLEKAKVPTQEAIKIISLNINNKLMKNILLQVTFDLSNGINLKDSLEKHRSYFPDFFITHIISGMEKGNLINTLELLFDYYNNKYIIDNKIKNSLVYPKLLILVFMFTFIIICMFIIPTFESLYNSFSTKNNSTFFKIFRIIKFVNSNLQLFILLIIMLFLFLFMIGKLKKVKYLKDYFKTLIFKRYYLIYYTYLFSQSVCLLWDMSFNKFDSIDILKCCIPNLYYQERIINLKEDIEKGLLFSDSLEKNRLFDVAYQKMFKISEYGNFQDNNLKRAAEYYKFEYLQILERRTKMIEPILILFVSILVIGLILFMFMPMINNIKEVI